MKTNLEFLSFGSDIFVFHHLRSDNLDYQNLAGELKRLEEQLKKLRVKQTKAFQVALRLDEVQLPKLITNSKCTHSLLDSLFLSLFLSLSLNFPKFSSMLNGLCKKRNEVTYNCL
jgi:hypothetical protein